MFSEHVLIKWNEWKDRGRFSATLSLRQSIENGHECWLKPDAKEAMCWLFNVRDKRYLWVRKTPLARYFTLITVGYGPDVIEVCSWRSMRQMGKAWVQLWRSVHPSCKQEADRLEEIFKFKFLREIKGGLIRQERSPRISRRVRAFHKARLDRKPSEYLEPNLDFMDV